MTKDELMNITSNDKATLTKVAKMMNKEEYQKRIQDRLLRVTIQRLEDQIQSIWDLIGDLQKGRIDAEDIPEYYKESEVV